MTISRRKLPPLNALRAFEVSGRRLSFRHAADELGVTQGAVAQQVRALEEYLGQTLFHRLPRGLALTSQGASFLVEMTQAFDVMSDAINHIQSHPNVVTISVTPSFAAKLLIPRLGELNARLPDIELRIIATESVSDFDRDQVDIAVRLTHDSFPPSLDAVCLFQQELIAVASPSLMVGHRLPLSLERLRQLPILHDSHNQWPTFFQTNEKPQGATFNQTTLAIDAALAGQGIALACRAFVEKDIAAGRLISVIDKRLIVKPSYYLVRKRSRAPQQAVEAVWTWCQQALSPSATQQS
ncbi:LysR substrate-binding domain-containing protein [Amphritea sp. 1_MG-2023]|uniref:LysR substrate-binding domain-containing protein n=1 Tax=Amphritea sp. 1_MG-2023 TaxID=3062670 RepID=UPI0026E21ABF|nr:LysR substrate-binding domain-containing protein [Amphritea sp. 1_MG-2023]MDO6563446.1 LysR substrate-binding domain-containing protein [Amphritea sp. 1_MG-2023]